MDEITLSVLGLKKENSWDVVALEMDLVTSGKTFEKALNNLKNLIEDQLSFASYKNQPELAFKSAPLEYFSLFAQVRQGLQLPQLPR